MIKCISISHPKLDRVYEVDFTKTSKQLNKALKGNIIPTALLLLMIVNCNAETLQGFDNVVYGKDCYGGETVVSLLKQFLKEHIEKGATIEAYKNEIPITILNAIKGAK